MKKRCLPAVAGALLGDQPLKLLRRGRQSSWQSVSDQLGAGIGA